MEQGLGGAPGEDEIWFKVRISAVKIEDAEASVGAIANNLGGKGGQR